jgi:hypothetical protein
VQNGNEIRLTSGDGVTVSDLGLSTVSTGSPVTISNSFTSGTIATGAVGTYTLLNMQIGSTDIVRFGYFQHGFHHAGSLCQRAENQYPK